MGPYAFICLHCWDEQSLFGFSSHISLHIYHFPVYVLSHFKLFIITIFLPTSCAKAPSALHQGIILFSYFFIFLPPCTVPLGFPNSLHCHPLILGCYAEMPATADPRLSPKAFATICLSNKQCSVCMGLCGCATDFSPIPSIGVKSRASRGSSLSTRKSMSFNYSRAFP